jgi:hypothetical protein
MFVTWNALQDKIYRLKTATANVFSKQAYIQYHAHLSNQ